MKASSNMLAKEKEDSWKDLPQATQSQTASQLITSLEKSAFDVADSMDEPLSAPIVHVEVNIGQLNFIGTNNSVSTEKL